MRSKTKKKLEQKSKKNGQFDHRWLNRSAITIIIIVGYLLYLSMIFMMRLPFIAEQYTEITIQDKIESHLSFTVDGEQSHYYIELENQSLPGQIDVLYYPKTNILYATLRNIISLTINCRSMFYDECKEVFGEPMQLIMCIEELGELTQCLCKQLRGKGDLEHLQEEIGDVILTATHMARIFGTDAVQKSINYKVERTVDILKNQ